MFFVDFLVYEKHFNFAKLGQCAVLIGFATFAPIVLMMVNAKNYLSFFGSRVRFFSFSCLPAVHCSRLTNLIWCFCRLVQHKS